MSTLRKQHHLKRNEKAFIYYYYFGRAQPNNISYNKQTKNIFPGLSQNVNELI